MTTRRRLPELPIDVWSAPPPPQPKGERQGQDLETNAVHFKPTAGFQPEQTIFVTSRRWQAVDVYVQIPANYFDGVVSAVRVKVYALTAAGRHLVASGFAQRPWNAARQSPQWACAARSVATRFEVTVACVGAHASSDDIFVSFVASDHADTPPPNVGVIPLRDGVQGTAIRALGDILTAEQILSLEPELVRAHAFNVNAALRWLVVVDEDTVASAIANATLANLSFGIAPNTTLIIPQEHISGRRFGTLGLVLGGSTSSALMAGPSADILWGAYIR